MLCALHTLPLVTGPVQSYTISTPFLEHTTLAAILALGTNRTHLHLSEVKHLRVKCLAQGHNIEIMSQY